MAAPNGRGGWDLTDDDVAEIVAVSYGEDDYVDLKPTQPDYKIRHKARILKGAWNRKEFHTDVDGFWYWVPSGPIGLCSSEYLRTLADLLEEANRRWSRQIKRYFEAEKNKR